MDAGNGMKFVRVKDAPTPADTAPERPTLRDLFALEAFKSALTVILSQPCHRDEYPERRRLVAESCYAHADAMILARGDHGTATTGLGDQKA